jgi:hypothetical protein
MDKAGVAIALATRRSYLQRWSYVHELSLTAPPGSKRVRDQRSGDHFFSHFDHPLVALLTSFLGTV